MERLVHVFWGPAAAGSDRYRDVLVGELAPALLGVGATDLAVTVDDSGSDCPSPVPTPDGEDPHVATVSFSLPAHDHRGATEDVIGTIAARLGLRWAGYLVSGAVWTEYGDNEHGRARDWGPGERSPAVLTVCLIHRPEAMDPVAWVRHWHDVQSPVSAAIQPRSRYVRNEVIRPLTDGAPEIGGIVAESWPSIEHIVDPMLFFLADGDPETMQRHVTEMIESVAAFIDMERMRNVTMSEYLW